MKYKGHNIEMHEGTKFTVTRTLTAAAVVGARDGSNYTVESDSMIYRASCDAGSTYAVNPEDALTLIKKLIDNLQ